MNLFFFLLIVLPAFWYTGVIIILRTGLARCTRSGESAGERFSVVIAARNEENHITACLESVFAQNIARDRFEVIIVDDRSGDRTPEILGRMREQNDMLTVVTIREIPAEAVPKKHAILEGIKRARNPVIVFTDADCLVPPAWLETIDCFLTSRTGFLQGITSYCAVPGMNRFFFGIQAVDFISHGIVSAAAIGAGVPFNANANNLALRRTAFDAVGGYGAAGAIVSGDDDLLLQKIWKHDDFTVGYMADPRGAVETFPTMSIRGVWEQRKRWGSITVHYNPAQIALLAGVFSLYCALAGTLIAGIFDHRFLAVCGALFAVKILGECVLMIPGTRLFGKRELLRFFLPASLLQLPLVLFAIVFGVFGRFSWKQQNFGRKVKY